MKNIVYLVKYGEIFTKGDNRYVFIADGNNAINLYNLSEKSKYLPIVTEQILKHRDGSSYKYLNFKYKIFLFDKISYIFIIFNF